MTEDLPQQFPFLTFKTKQYVSKSKLGGEFAKKGWNDFSNGFSEISSIHAQGTLFAKGKESIEKQPKIDANVFKKHKIKQRKPITELQEADFISYKVKDLCHLIERKSFQTEDKKNVKTHNLNNYPNSVFLEVQNIQNSCRQFKSTYQPNICFQSPELNRNFINDLAVKKTNGQENVPKKRRVTACQFSLQENDFYLSGPVKKVKKTNVFADLCSSLAKKNSSVINSLSEPITNSKSVPAYSEKIHCRIKGSDSMKVPMNTGVFFLDDKRNVSASFNLPPFLEDEFSENKGSNWLQSLQISVSEVSKEDAVGKKRIRNILPGGFVEQLLKLLRIEKSEEAIWDHNMDKRKKENCLLLMLISISSSGDIVIAKCLSIETEFSKSPIVKESDEISTRRVLPKSKRVVVLMKKSVFTKLHLKARSIFHLYPPWQTFNLPLMSCPVILCAKFIDLNSCTGKVPEDGILYGVPIASSSTSVSNQDS